MPTFRFNTDRTTRTSRLSRWRRFLPSFLRSARRKEHLTTRIFQPGRRVRDFLTRKQIFLITGMSALLAIGIGFFYFSGIFDITKISVLRNSLDLPLAEIETTVRQSVLKQNIFTLDTSALEKSVKQIRPEIARVAITKNFPHELTVEIFKYPVVAEVRVGGTSIYVNADGYRVYGEKPERDTLTLLLGESLDIDDKTQRIVLPEHLEKIRDAVNYFTSLTGIGVKSIVYFPTAREIHLHTEKNFDIWLDLILDFRSQLDKLSNVGRLLDLKGGKYEYLDLRVRNKIFYKAKR